MLNQIQNIRARGGDVLFLMGIRGISLVSKFILTLFIARYMGFEDLGVYGLIVSATFVVPAFLSLGIMTMKCRMAVTQSSDDIVDMIYNYGRYLAVIYSVLAVVGFLIGFWQQSIWLWLGIVFVILFEHINNDFYNLLLNLSKQLSANILHFVRTAVWIFLFMAVAFFNPAWQEIELLLSFWIVGDVISVIGFVFVNRLWDWRKKTPFIPFMSWVKQEVKPAKNIYFNGILDSSSQYLNHFLVTFFLGLELTGVYVYFLQIINALSNLLRTGVILVARPKLVQAHKMMEDTFLTIYKKCLKHTVFIAVLMSIFSVPAMYILTDQIVDKPLAMEWFPIFGLNLLFFVLLMIAEAGQLVLYSHHRDDLSLKLSVVNITSLVVLNLILIPFMSLWGAVIALVISAIIRVVVQSILIKKLVGI